MYRGAMKGVTPAKRAPNGRPYGIRASFSEWGARIARPPTENCFRDPAHVPYLQGTDYRGSCGAAQ